MQIGAGVLQSGAGVMQIGAGVMQNKPDGSPLMKDGPSRPPGTREGPTSLWGRALRDSRSETGQPNVEDGRQGAPMGSNG